MQSHNSRPIEVKVEKGMNIWGEFSCSQCGACCIEYNCYRFEAGRTEKLGCDNFRIEEGKAFCLEHEGCRRHICETYYCGNTNNYLRFQEKGDERLRNIAIRLGTAPKEYRIPRLIVR